MYHEIDQTKLTNAFRGAVTKVEKALAARRVIDEKNAPTKAINKEIKAYNFQFAERDPRRKRLIKLPYRIKPIHQRIFAAETRSRSKRHLRSWADWLQAVEAYPGNRDLRNHLGCIVWWDHVDLKGDTDLFDDHLTSRYYELDPPHVVCIALHKLGYSCHAAYKRSKPAASIHEPRDEHPEDAGFEGYSYRGAAPLLSDNFIG